MGKEYTTVYTSSYKCKYTFNNNTFCLSTNIDNISREEYLEKITELSNELYEKLEPYKLACEMNDIQGYDIFEEIMNNIIKEFSNLATEVIKILKHFDGLFNLNSNSLLESAFFYDEDEYKKFIKKSFNNSYDTHIMSMWA